MSMSLEGVVTKFNSLFMRNNNVESGISGTGNRKYIKYLSMTVVPAIAVLGLYFAISSHANKSQAFDVQNKKSDVILSELNDISTQLDRLTVNPAEPRESEKALKQISSDISDIHNVIATIAKSDDVQKVSDEVSAVKDDVDTQMEDIKKTMSESIGNKQYLDSDVLPFHVISVDMIGGEPYVSVNYQDHVSPLGVSDLMAGWRLSSADYDSGSVEFVNEKNQYVKIGLQG